MSLLLARESFFGRKGKWLFAAIICSGVSAVTAVLAQEELDQDDPEAPGTLHAMGNVPDALAVTRSLPRVARYRAFLPVSVDLSARIPKPGNQKQMGSCTSWAVAYAARSYYTALLEKRPNSLSSNIPSPRYVYQMSAQGTCRGTSFAEAVEVLKAGALSLKAYPYKTDCLHEPSSSQIAQAIDFKVDGISILDATDTNDIRGELAKGNPVIFSLQVGPGWNLTGKNQGVSGGYLLEGNDQLIAGNSHAMTLVGYDDRRQAFKLINSWGRNWGEHGYAWMSYDFVKNHRVEEAVVLNVEPPPRPAPEPSPEPAPEPIPPTPPNPIPPVPPAPKPKPVPINIEDLKCSKIEKKIENGQEQLSGFVQSDADYQLVQKAAQTGENTKVNLRVLPFPLCEAAQTLDKPLKDADRPEIDTGGKTKFREGDTLSFKIRSTQSLRFLYAVYFSHDGDVQTLVQPNGFVPTQAEPRKEFIFGDGIAGRQKFTVTGPFGHEMIVVLASKSPLFDRPLPDSQTEREFLSELRKQLIYKPDASMADRVVSAAVVTLVTEGRH